VALFGSRTAFDYCAEKRNDGRPTTATLLLSYVVFIAQICWATQRSSDSSCGAAACCRVHQLLCRTQGRTDIHIECACRLITCADSLTADWCACAAALLPSRHAAAAAAAAAVSLALRYCYFTAAIHEPVCNHTLKSGIAPQIPATMPSTADTLLCYARTLPPKHIAAAVSPTRHGVLGITLHTRADGPAASSSCWTVMPAAMLITSVSSLSTGRASVSTVCTYCGLTDTKTTSQFLATCIRRRWPETCVGVWMCGQKAAGAAG
jgi:hypothetical protein